jgi:PAS domain S-box-containing protein
MDATSAHPFSSDQILSQFLIIQTQLSEHEARLREWKTQFALGEEFSLAEAANFFEQIKNALEFWEKRYHLLWTQTTNRVLELDAQGIILNVNPALCQCTGYAEVELIGQSWWEILSPSDPSGGLPELAERLQSGEIFEFTVTINGKAHPALAARYQRNRAPRPPGQLDLGYTLQHGDLVGGALQHLRAQSGGVRSQL